MPKEFIILLHESKNTYNNFTAGLRGLETKYKKCNFYVNTDAINTLCFEDFLSKRF